MRIEVGKEVIQFRNALVAAFNQDDLDEMLRWHFDLELENFSGANKPAKVLDVIDHFNKRWKVEKLLRAARESRPHDPNLHIIAQRLGVAAGMPSNITSDRQLQLMINAANGMLNVRPFYTRMAETEHRICRVEIYDTPPAFGTGFLLGSDVVMTNYHVMESVIKEKIEPEKVAFRFDFAIMSDGVTPDAGTVYQLVQQNWLIDHSEYSPLDKMADTGRQEPPPDKLDYALLRVEGEPGNDPVGGTKNKDPNAESRGWIKSPTSAHDFVPDTAVLIMQHPQGATLKLAWETQSVISVNEKKSRVRYRTNTEPGSSGSPCFDANWNLIALHHLGDASYDGFNQPEYNQGIPFNTILDLLEKREKKDELGK